MGDDPVAKQVAKHVEEWRLKHKLTQDTDFAYRFSSVDEAFAEAGRAVAEAWNRVAVLSRGETRRDELRLKAMRMCSAEGKILSSATSSTEEVTLKPRP